MTPEFLTCQLCEPFARDGNTVSINDAARIARGCPWHRECETCERACSADWAVQKAANEILITLRCP